MRALVGHAEGYEVVLVASNKPEAPGIAWAKEHLIPTWSTDSRGMTKAEWEAGLEAEVDRHSAGTIALAGFMRILSPEFTARWSGRIVNAQAQVPVLAGDTPETLESRVLEAEHRLYPRALSEFVSR